MQKKHIISLSTLLFLTWMGTANAITIYLDSTLSEADNKITLNLGAGTYSVTPTTSTDDTLYDAWNAWGNKVAYNATTSSYTQGWITKYSIDSDLFEAQNYYSGIKYATAAEALENAIVSYFSLSEATDVTFYISDSYYNDNLGGISLSITPVPEPATMLLFGLGLAGLASFIRRK